VDGSGPWSGATVGSATGGPQNDLDGPPVQLVGLAIEPSLVLWGRCRESAPRGPSRDSGGARVPRRGCCGLTFGQHRKMPALWAARERPKAHGRHPSFDGSVGSLGRWGGCCLSVAWSRRTARSRDRAGVVSSPEAIRASTRIPDWFRCTTRPRMLASSTEHRLGRAASCRARKRIRRRPITGCAIPAITRLTSFAARNTQDAVTPLLAQRRSRVSGCRRFLHSSRRRLAHSL